MEIKFVNRGLLNIIEPLNIKEEEIDTVLIGECSFILRLKDGRQFVKCYKSYKSDALQAMDWKND